MSLKPVLPPQQYSEIVSQAVGDLMSRPQAVGRPLALGGAPEQTDVAAPHEVYTMSLGDVAGGDLHKAQKTAWRYLVVQGGHAVAAAELHDTAGGQPEFSHLNTGPFVQATALAITEAENSAEVEQRDFVVRLLTIPALSVMALWLHAADRDLLNPLPPSDSHLSVKQWYSPTEFFKLLAPVATSRQTFDDSPRGPSGG
jgi:hypothetical protein